MSCVACGGSVHLKVEPSTIQAGETATLDWKVEAASDAVVLGVGSVTRSGALRVAPTRSIEYVLVSETASGVVLRSARIEVTGSKSGDDLPRDADFQFPMTRAFRPRSTPSFVDAIGPLLQSMQMTVDQFKTIDDHIIFKTGFAQRSDLLLREDSNNHIGARRIAFLVDVLPFDSKTRTLTITSRALIQYRRQIESTWRLESDNNMYGDQLNALLDQLTTLSLAPRK